MKTTRLLAVLLAELFLLPTLAHAGEYVLTLKDHAFSPAELTIPAGEKATLKVKNLDATPAEFESHDLDREKIVGGNGEITINVGPLKPGNYKFFDEFHEDTAKGVIIVK